MIRIEKEEAEFLRDRFPGLTVTRTMKHRSERHHYYVEESRKVLSALERFREGGANEKS